MPFGSTAKGLAGALGLLISSCVTAADLRSVIEQTLANSPEVLTTTTERDSRIHEVRQAQAGYYPTLDLAAGMGREWTDSPGTGGTEVELTRTERSLSFRQMLFDSYATPSEVARQKARVNSAAYTVRGTAEDIALSTTEVYLELMNRQEQERLAQENLETHRRIHDQIGLRLARGLTSQANFSQIEGRLALAESNAIAATNNVHEAQANYIRVTGQQPDDLQPAQDFSETLPAEFELALDQAFDDHPTLASANADIDAARHQHDAARHNLYPRVHFEVDKSWDENIDGVRGDNEDLTAMVRLRWNLFNGGRDKARRKQTAELVEEARAVRDRSHRQVEQTLRLAWTAHQSTLRQLKFLRKHRDATERVRDLYTQQFTANKRSLLDLLDTENELFESQRDYLDAFYANLLAQYRILNAKGQLLSALQVAPPPQAALYQEPDPE